MRLRCETTIVTRRRLCRYNRTLIGTAQRTHRIREARAQNCSDNRSCPFSQHELDVAKTYECLQVAAMKGLENPLVCTMYNRFEQVSTGERRSLQFGVRAADSNDGFGDRQLLPAAMDDKPSPHAANATNANADPTINPVWGSANLAEMLR